MIIYNKCMLLFKSIKAYLKNLIIIKIRNISLNKQLLSYHKILRIYNRYRVYKEKKKSLMKY